MKSGPFLARLLAGLAVVAIGAPASALEPRAAAPRRIEVVFVLDTTGSMSGLLDAAKEQVWAIATELACAKPAPELRLGLLAFRDRGDEYVTRLTDLTTDMDALYTELVGLQAGGGGDEPESVNQALHEAVTRMSWSDDAGTYRVLFLVGDAPPKNYADDVAYGTSSAQAQRRGISVNTIQCGGSAATKPVWSEIAARGGGVYSTLDQAAQRQTVVTPYDDAIAAMARQLDETRLPYGSAEERAAAEERRARAAAIAEESSVTARAERGLFNLTAAGRTNVFGERDLLADVRSGAARLEDLSDDRLPEELRDQTAEERRALLERREKLRQDLQLTMQMFAGRREDYLAKHGAQEGTLTKRLFAAMQPQATLRGFTLAGCPFAPR